MDAISSNPETEGRNPALTAAMGMVAGAIGVWAMDRADYFMWDREDRETRERTRAVRPYGEPPAAVVVTELEQASGRNLNDTQHDAAETAVHYSIGIGPAAGYALTRDQLPGGPARGLLYGLGVFLLQDEGINAVTRLGGDLRDYPWQDHGRGLIAHLVYGLTTELALSAMERLLPDGSAQGSKTLVSDERSREETVQPFVGAG